MCYDGKRWAKDEGNAQIEKTAQAFQRAAAVYFDLSVPDPKKQSDSEKAFLKFVNRLADRSQRLNMIRDAAAYLAITYEDLDKHENYLNCRNGTLDLQTLELKAHSSADLLSMMTGCSYDPAAPFDAWLEFLNEIMEDDQDKIRYLQKIAGYCLTCDTTQEQSFILYGASSRNGKSTFIETLGRMLGDYSITADPAILEERPKNSSNASPDLARIAGRRLIRISELPRRMLFNSSLFKQLTGGDSISARYLYEGLFEFTPVGKIIFNSNHLPIISDTSVFASDRLKVIEFNRHFEEFEQDKTLKRRLCSAANLSGILNWAIEGLQLYREEGLNAPAVVQIATENFHADSDKLQNFINECLEKGSGYAITMKDAYQYYQLWCHENGYGCDSKASFKTDLQTRGLLSPNGTVHGQTRHNVLIGYDVTQEFMNEHMNALL